MATVASPRRRRQAGRALSTATPGGTQALNPEGAISVPGSGLVNRWSDDKYRGRMRALLEAHAGAKCELLSGELRAVNELVHGASPLTERQRLRANGLLTKYAWAIPASSDNGYQPVCQTPGCDDPMGHALAAAADEGEEPELAGPDEPEEAGAVDQATLDAVARLYSGDTYRDAKQPTVRGLIDASDVEALEAYGDAVWVCIGTQGTGGDGIEQVVLQQVVRADDVGSVAGVYATRDAQPIRALGQVWKLVDRRIKLRRAGGVVSQETPVHDPIGKIVDKDATFKKLRAAPPAARNIGSQTLSRIALDKIDRHPDNRVPSATAVADLAASIEREGLLEPPVVRRSPDQPGRYQLISGETRILALRQLGRQGEIDAHVIACDSARALELLATYNAKRTDLTPIEKAQMLRRLMDPIASGGGGMTSEQAAAVYGFETGAAARNLVRLLELPEIWQARVAAGDLPQTFARELLRVAHVAPVMAELDRDFQDWIKDPGAFNDTFSSREDLVRAIDYEIDECTRPITPGRTYAFSDHKNGIPYGNYGCAFSVTEELREQLGVVTITTTAYKGQGRKRKAVTEEGEFATNVNLYDKLQVAALKQRLAAKSKTASKNQADADERKLAKKDRPAPTPAELKARAKEQAEQLATRVRAWRHRLLSDAIAARFGGGEEQYWATGKLVLWMITVGCGGQEIRTALLGRTKYDWLSDPWATLGQVLPAGESPHDNQARANYHQILQDVAAALLRRPDSDPRRPHVPFEVVEGLALAMGVDIAAEWLKLQQPTDRYAGKTCPNEAKRESFYLLFQSAQLDALGKELGVHVADAKKREDKVRILVNIGRALPLPACLRLPEAKKGAKR